MNILQSILQGATNHIVSVKKLVLYRFFKEAIPLVNSGHFGDNDRRTTTSENNACADLVKYTLLEVLALIICWFKVTEFCLSCQIRLLKKMINFAY